MAGNSRLLAVSRWSLARPWILTWRMGVAVRKITLVLDLLGALQDRRPRSSLRFRRYRERSCAPSSAGRSSCASLASPSGRSGRDGTAFAGGDVLTGLVDFIDEVLVLDAMSDEGGVGGLLEQGFLGGEVEPGVVEELFYDRVENGGTLTGEYGLVQRVGDGEKFLVMIVADGDFNAETWVPPHKRHDCSLLTL